MFCSCETDRIENKNLKQKFHSFRLMATRRHKKWAGDVCSHSSRKPLNASLNILLRLHHRHRYCCWLLRRKPLFSNLEFMENATRILRRQSEKEIIEYLAVVELK